MWACTSFCCSCRCWLAVEQLFRYAPSVRAACFCFNVAFHPLLTIFSCCLVVYMMSAPANTMPKAGRRAKTLIKSPAARQKYWLKVITRIREILHTAEQRIGQEEVEWLFAYSSQQSIHTKVHVAISGGLQVLILSDNRCCVKQIFFVKSCMLVSCIAGLPSLS